MAEEAAAKLKTIDEDRALVKKALQENGSFLGMSGEKLQEYFLQLNKEAGTLEQTILLAKKAEADAPDTAAAGSGGLRQRRGAEKPAAGTAVTDVAEQASKASSPEELMKIFEDKMRGVLAEKAKAEGKGDTPESLEKAVNEGLQQLFEPKKKPLPGLTNETKAAKDALTANPYDLHLIYELGVRYLIDEKYTEAANVLVRGWKRVGEFDNPEHRYLFLAQCCHASFACQKYKQAYAVLMDMEEPEDPEHLRDYCSLSCKIYSENDQLQKALKSFHKALEGHSNFEDALQVWIETLSSLKKVGAYEAAKGTMDKLAVTEEQKQKLKVVSSVNELKDNLEESAKNDNGGAQRILLIGFLAVAICGMVYILYWLEQRSLKAFKIK